MQNRDQLTWQMEVTGVTGHTWTCEGNGGGISSTAKQCDDYFLHKQKVEIEMWSEITKFLSTLYDIVISNVKSILLKAYLCYFMEG